MEEEQKKQEESKEEKAEESTETKPEDVPKETPEEKLEEKDTQGSTKSEEPKEEPHSEETKQEPEAEPREDPDEEKKEKPKPEDKTEPKTSLKTGGPSAHLKKIEEKLMAQAGPLEDLKEDLDEPKKLIEEESAIDKPISEEAMFDIYEEEGPKKTSRRKRIRIDKEEPSEPEKKVKEDPEIQKIKERILALRDKLLTLKWDYDRGQINPAKKVQYEKLKKEVDELEAKLKSAVSE